MENDTNYEDRLEFLKLIASTMAHAANEVLILTRLELHFDPKPAHIAGTDEQIKSLEHSTQRLCALLGGPPPRIIVEPGKPRPRYDTFPSAAIDEAVLMFLRARSAVCRTHLHFIGGSMIKREPEMVTGWPTDQKLAELHKHIAVGLFWEHAETAYVKLASLWDRLGQLLDFVFFNIRQFERDGFPAVLDRIHNNYVPMSKEIGSSHCWAAIRRFQNSEKPDGLKWLLRRRNLIIHSLHLREREEGNFSDPLFDSAYNHLEESARRKLAPASTEEELNYMHGQLREAANLFPEVLSLCEIGACIRLS